MHVAYLPTCHFLYDYSKCLIMSTDLIMPNARATFEVQTHPPGSISFDQIKWKSKEQKGWGYGISVMSAYIPFDRVDDFIGGQTCPDGLPVDWNVAHRILGKDKRRPQITSFIEHVWYECAFGPEDYIGDSEHPHSKKCGCIAKFSIKQLLLHHDVAEVAYYHVDHIREDGTRHTRAWVQ